MASNVNAKTIDGNYPIANQDNDSQGFRDNFTNIRNNLAIASFEITTLQDQVVQLQENVSLGQFDIPVASQTVLGGVIIGDNITVSESGVISVPVPFSGSYADLSNKPTIPTDVNQLQDTEGLLDVDGLPPQSGNSGKYLTTDGTNAAWDIPKFQRKIVSVTTPVLASNASANVEIGDSAKSYLIYKMTTSSPAWVRLYTDSQSRTNDASRPESDDPQSGIGLILEAFTTNSTPVVVSPAVAGFNSETVPTATIPIRVTNKNTISNAITITLEILVLE